MIGRQLTVNREPNLEDVFYPLLQAALFTSWVAIAAMKPQPATASMWSGQGMKEVERLPGWRSSQFHAESHFGP